MNSFLETKFLEYSNYEDFMSDGTFTLTEDRNKGILLLFNNEEHFL